MNHLRKFLLLLTVSIAISLSLLAQDKIYKTDGDIIEAKVKRVDPTAIVYKRFDNQDGPEYGILKKEVVKIVYENGTTDVFRGGDGNDGKDQSRGGKSGKVVKNKYGNNILSVTPAAYTVSVDGSINDVGLGLCYERLLDKRGHIGFNLPVMINFASTHDFNNYYYNGYNNNNVNYTDHYHSFFFEPGIKFYPAGSNTRVRYSIGASLFCAFGTEPMGVFDFNTASPTSTYHYSMTGLMLSNSINITATRHLCMAIDLATGVPISDNRHNNYDQTIGGLAAPFLQFGFKIGYRY
jgi:hypothetical protein